ncbi:hypothetical protein BJX61DRAFT_246223 [Aspergillus egyptiacus]|nr:hypothetical protein BJX61DRAFT_246223 [Aspergillus egyptiacus]
MECSRNMLRLRHRSLYMLESPFQPGFLGWDLSRLLQRFVTLDERWIVVHRLFYHRGVSSSITVSKKRVDFQYQSLRNVC